MHTLRGIELKNELARMTKCLVIGAVREGNSIFLRMDMLAGMNECSIGDGQNGNIPRRAARRDARCGAQWVESTREVGYEIFDYNSKF